MQFDKIDLGLCFTKLWVEIFHMKWCFVDIRTCYVFRFPKISSQHTYHRLIILVWSLKPALEWTQTFNGCFKWSWYAFTKKSYFAGEDMLLLKVTNWLRVAFCPQSLVRMHFLLKNNEPAMCWWRLIADCHNQNFLVSVKLNVFHAY